MPTLKFWDGTQYVPLVGGPSGPSGITQEEADARYLQQSSADARYVLQQDTGWRSLASLLINGWTARSGYPGVAVRRIGSFVSCKIDGLNPPVTPNAVAMNAVAGFQPTPAMYPHFPFVGQSSWQVIAGISGGISTSVSQYLYITGSPDPANGTYLSAFVTYPTDDPWPSTLPGTPL